MNATPSDSDPGTPPSAWERIDDVCQRFESAWQAGQRPNIDDFLSPRARTDPAAPEHELLVELVLTDLEYRWQAAAAQPGETTADPDPSFPARPRLEDYLARFPALGSADRLPEDLIGDEYRIRQGKNWGDHPSIDEYVQRFGRGRPRLADLLRGIDRELATPHPRAEIALVDSPDPAAAGPGTTLRYFGDYELLEEIGRGGMGVVFRARQVSLNRIVAVKMILAAWLADETAVQRFYAEAEAAARLDHPGIVPVYEVGQHAGQHYFSMGFVDGQSLAKRLAEQGPLGPREAAEPLRKVALAMHCAHGQGVLHRDLKPYNILLDREGEPRVSDFGLAKQLDRETGLTLTGEPLGTAGYMPPEQATGAHAALTARSDLYALGATLYETLTGRPPFLAATRHETLRQVQECEPLDPWLLNPQIPRDLSAIVLKCLEKSPERRYATARDLADDLTRFLDGRPTLARPASRLEKAVRWCRRRPAVAGLAATVLLLLLALVGLGTGAYLRLAAAYWSEVDLNAEKDRLNTQKDGLIADKDRLIADKQRLVTEKEQEARRALDAEQAVREQLAEVQRLSAAAELQHADMAAQRGNWRTVLERLARARELGGSASPRQLLLAARAHQTLNQGPDARRILESLGTRTDLLPAEAAETKLLLGDLALAGSGDYEAALNAIREARKLGLPPALDEYAAGLLCDKLPEARAHFEKSLELDPFYEPAHAALLVLLVFSGQEAEVERRAAFLQLAFPEDFTPHLARGLSRLFQGDRPGAEKHLQKVYEVVDQADRADLERLLGLYGDIASAMESLGMGKQLSPATALGLMARGSVAYVGGKDAAVKFGNPNLPYLRSSFGKLPGFLMKAVTFRKRTAIDELESIVQCNPDGIFYFLLGQLKAGEVTSKTSFDVAELGALYPLFRQAAKTPSAFPFYRRQAELWMIAYAQPLATPGRADYDPQVREETAAAIAKFLTYDALTPIEWERLACVSLQAELWDTAQAVCDRWVRDCPADAAAVQGSMKLAVRERHYARVLELFERLPAAVPRSAEMQTLADQARQALRELAAQLAEDQPAADKPTPPPEGPP